MDGQPDPKVLEGALRKAVTNAHEAGTLHELTANKAREAAEQELGLDSGFFKSHATWKSRSKDIITEALASIEEAEPASESTTKSKPKPKPNSKPEPKAKASASSAQSKKRTPAHTEAKPSKRRKRVVAEDSDDSASDAESKSISDINGEDVEEVTAVEQNEVNSIAERSESELSELIDEPVQKRKGKESSSTTKSKPAINKQVGGSESELSDVIDEPVKKRKGRQTSTATKSKAAAKPKPTKASKKQDDISPDDAEIKRLQGWLIKCGIRKLWHKELASYDTSKAKINHLKDMLKDAGMDGRYSVEKASAIKERRELAADLEAVQEGNKQWGHGPDEDEVEEEEEQKAPRTRRPAARFVDFGDSEDESD